MINLTINNPYRVPAGTMLEWPSGVTLPTGYLDCTGGTVSRTTYAALFAAIGTTYGAGDGTTTFGLPNFKYRNVPDSIPVKGNGKALGIQTSNGTFYWGQRKTSSTVPSTIYSVNTNGNAGAANSNINDTNANDKTYVGIATATANSGIVGVATGFTSCRIIIKY